MSNSCPIIESIERSHRRTDLPLFRAGDRVRVHVRITEGSKERIQVFEGVCIHRKRGGARRSFTIRKMSHGVGVERVWPESSPNVVKVDVVTRGRVRRAKLYYLRGLRGNAARIRAKIGEHAETLAARAAEADRAAAEAAVADEPAGDEPTPQAADEAAGDEAKE